MTGCGKGWGQRCPDSRGKRCKCRCGGERHGVYRRERELRESVEPLIPLGGFTISETGRPQLVLSF